jgi:hypothetical protein
MSGLRAFCYMHLSIDTLFLPLIYQSKLSKLFASGYNRMIEICYATSVSSQKTIKVLPTASRTLNCLLTPQQRR